MDFIVALPRDNKKPRPPVRSYSSQIQMVVDFMVEARGIEPLSESSWICLSPSAV